MKHVLAFSGSLSSDSINHELLIHAVSHLSRTDPKLISLHDYPIPLFSTDLEREGLPANVSALRALFDSADGFMLAVPEYNSSIPAGFKNMVDWLSRTGGKTFQDKPVLLLSTSPGARGGASVQQHLLSVMPFWGAQVAASYSLPKFKENFVNGRPEEPYLNLLVEAVNTFEQAVLER
jgi:chromate reductase, NAD(P)H dehydrogenase (quinone)